jgi:hypothetical protein
MIVAFDTGMLSLSLHQKAQFPHVPGTDAPVQQPKERIQFLVDELTNDRATIVIPAPALAEFLVVVEEAGPEYIRTLNRSARFDIRPFDTMAAVEAAEMFRLFRAAGDWRGGSTDERQKVKVDQQIVAIAKVSSAERFFAADRSILTIATSWKSKTNWNVHVIAVWDLPLPPLDAQGSLLDQIG